MARCTMLLSMEQAKGLQLLVSIKELRLLVLSTRPRQWSKNLIIYFAFFFAINRLWDSDDPGSIATPLIRASVAFVIFCAVAGAIYLINDWTDVERDRAHPIKRQRPLASGELRPRVAFAGVVLLVGTGLPAAFLLEPWFGFTAALYMVLMIAYSIVLKQIPVLDVMAISAGFVLRAVAGAVAIGVPISPWLYITTVLGALFIGFGKRSNELYLAGDRGEAQREALRGYSPRLLDRSLWVTVGATLIAYVVYSFTSANLPDNHAMMLTIPMVTFGLFRYLHLIRHRNLGESPEEIFLSDVPLIAALLLWLVTAASVLLLFGE